MIFYFLKKPACFLIQIWSWYTGYLASAGKHHNNIWLIREKILREISLFFSSRHSP
ncbi:hypothetical protein ETA_09360 [Erwinia tasmaniensis Et1/99]|uniref:Uncharacterized protein n=1 Tax=Erwinia tasmaniensis (strain DSM 17950 / CFBP 7177 / CIP 109463 / NCPPB 4357 / Et1/99) TaxID=465817 RepID=B2VDZ2_ERWT9|nr:hypothetical protein ETA_09360 [Erwinia tasmaniensis Et1/99]